MCGIVGAIGQRAVLPILIDGLKRLEYRGYDSAGVAVLDGHRIQRRRAMGKVAALEQALEENPLTGSAGIAHTRWATHGKPSEKNAHPHVVNERIALVHNGIIENYKELCESKKIKTSDLSSETDSEVVAWCINEHLNHGLDILQAVQAVCSELEGAYALAVLDMQDQSRVIVARHGSPLVIGLGLGENFLASDPLALQKVTNEFIFLEDGDVAEITRDQIKIYDLAKMPVQRQVHNKQINFDAAEKGEYRHYMQKEIFEQPTALTSTLSGRVSGDHLLELAFGPKAKTIFDNTKQVQIVACGTSYHAALVAKNWIEKLAGLPCLVDIASEYRYRYRVMQDNTLFVTVSQSGETADTLAALKDIQKNHASHFCGTLTICNVPESSLVRASDLCFLTHAGPEVGVATTKGFTTQLVGLLMLALMLGAHNELAPEESAKIVRELQRLPNLCQNLLELDGAIKEIAKGFQDKAHTLFLGRGILFPIALEGALKLKEISYIHAEAYPAGELKHGPLALVDSHMPVVVTAPKDALIEKLKANIQEVHARGGQLVVFAEKGANLQPADDMIVLELPEIPEILAPILFTIPLQLLSYYVAVEKGTDVDQPRNLAKSVTVE